MKLSSSCCIASLVIGIVCPLTSFAEFGFIYGKVHTDDQRVYEGRILWDNHESCWEDILDANHQFRTTYPHGDNRVVKIFGIRVSDRDRRRGGGKMTASMAIKFGHLDGIRRRSRNSAILELKDGRNIEVTSSGTDIGSSNRGIIVEDYNGRIKVGWKDFSWAEFMSEPPTYAREVGLEDVFRLCGRVYVRSGEIFEGAIMWDNDESLSNHVLDGREGGEDVELEFSEIAALEKDGKNACTVELWDGEVLRLTGSNDVNSGNRGLVVHDPSYGQITVPWRYFDRLELIEPTARFLRSYDEFDGGAPLSGTVEDKDGEFYTGGLRWDDDESYSCEMLDGEFKHLEVKIEMGNIRSIRYRSQRAAIVELMGNKKLKLTGSNDVGSGNKGVVITPTRGEDVLVKWYDLERVDFE